MKDVKRIQLGEGVSLVVNMKTRNLMVVRAGDCLSMVDATAAHVLKIAEALTEVSVELMKLEGADFEAKMAGGGS